MAFKIYRQGNYLRIEEDTGKFNNYTRFAVDVVITSNQGQPTFFNFYDRSKTSNDVAMPFFSEEIANLKDEGGAAFTVDNFISFFTTNTGVPVVISPVVLDSGLEGFFLNPRGLIGSGPGWADEDLIGDMPVIAFNNNSTEKAIYAFFVAVRFLVDSIDPQVKFVVHSTGEPEAGAEDTRWQLECRYIAETELDTKAADETLFVTHRLDTFVENTKQAILIFTLDRTLMEIGDDMLFTLSRIGGAAADTYASDAGIGQAGVIIETTNHNP